ncbi:hypothetical protein HaLaN_22237, partial [Haematococcus lacustris]
WLGSAGHPQDTLAQCRRVVGALRIGAAASPRGVCEYTTAHVNSSSQLQLRLSSSRSLPAHSTCQHLLTALLPDMPHVPKHTRASRANGAKSQAGHEAAKSMEQLTATHVALTVAHAALTAELLSSQQ